MNQMTTQVGQTLRDQEIGRLESEIINAWVANGERLPRAAFVALVSSAKIACDPVRFDAELAADRALDRLRKAAEAVRS